MPDGRPFPRIFALFLLSALLAPRSAFAGPDFFGIKMKSEDFARNVMIQENYMTPDFTSRPGTDKRVYAYGYASTFLGRGRGLSITVYNHSDAPIGTERLFRECTILMNDGHRYDRSQPEMEWRRDVLKPGEQGTFNIAFPGVDVRAQDIRMIILSFDLGETKIFLLPMPPPEAPAKALEKKPEPAQQVKTPPPPAKSKPVKKEAAKKPAPAPKTQDVQAEEAGPEEPAGEHCETPLKRIQSFFRRMGKQFETAANGPVAGKGESFMESRAAARAEKEGAEIEAPEEEPAQVAATAPGHEDKNIPASYPEYQDYAKASQVIEGVTYNFRPNFRNEVKEAETVTVDNITKDRSWSLNDPNRAMVREWRIEEPSGELPRPAAEVVLVQPNNVFLVFDAGLEDGVLPNSIVSVLRDGRRVGKAMVSKARDRVSAALILPEWRTKDTIRVGDVVSLTE